VKKDNFENRINWNYAVLNNKQQQQHQHQQQQYHNKNTTKTQQIHFILKLFVLAFRVVTH
jgi:hypothetical protein